MIWTDSIKDFVVPQSGWYKPLLANTDHEL